MIGFHELTILICTALPGIPPECVEAYKVRHPETREIIRFEAAEDCSVASGEHELAIYDALRSVSQPRVISAQGRCNWRSGK